jgi:hypothetical protein
MSEEEKNWKDSLPEEIRDSKGLADVKDVGSLAQQFLDSQSMIGNSIRVPGPEAGEDAWSAFHEKLTSKVPTLIPTPDPDNPEVMSALYKRMGRPEDPSGYEHPEGVDATKMADFANLSHELGLTKTQYAKMVGSLQEFTTKQEEAASQQFLEGIRGLKQEWGIVYEDNLQMVDQVMKGTEAPAYLKELAADGKMPAEALKWLHNIGQQLGTEGINFNKDEFSSRVTPAEAKARSAEIMNDRAGPYWDSSHPQHQEYVKRVVDLNRAAAAGGR